MLAAACCMLAITAATFTSCDPNKAQCWKLQVTFEGGATQEEYFYGTGVEADAHLEEIRVAAQGKVTRLHREQTFQSQENCHK